MLIELYRKFNFLPAAVRIEACSLCNLSCRDCYMRKNSDFPPVIGNGYLKFQDFKNFIRNNPFIKNIELSLSGEIFLNPELKKIIRLAAYKKINLTAFNGVNFNSVSDVMLEYLVKYKFKGITFSVDGVSNETYSMYRIHGNYDKVIENIKKLNEIKRKYNSKFPVLQWQFIVFKHNKHEVNKAINIARELNMVCIYFKAPWNNEITKHDCNFLGRLIHFKPYYDKDILPILKSNEIELCMQPWLAPQINWDGRLLGCCCSTHHDLGVNVFEIGLKQALKSDKMQKMRFLLTGRNVSDTMIACKHCYKYQFMKKTGRYLVEKDVLSLL